MIKTICWIGLAVIAVIFILMLIQDFMRKDGPAAKEAPKPETEGSAVKGARRAEQMIKLDAMEVTRQPTADREED